MRTINDLIESIKKDVKPVMDQWVVDNLEHINSLEVIAKNMRQTEEFATILSRHIEAFKGKRGFANAYAVAEYKAIHGITKSIEQGYFHRTKEDKLLKLQKMADHKLLKIDVAVNKKLSNVDVKTIKRIDFKTDNKDIYVEGAWLINGDKTFSFSTIYAGGYNIQKLHVRTIYRFK